MEKCKQETSATKMAEYYGIITPDQAGWNTQTCVLGWGVVGIWPPGADGSDVNSADRSVCGRYVATGDDFGQLKIFNNPCAKVGLFIQFYFAFMSYIVDSRFMRAYLCVFSGIFINVGEFF
jgi:hypothetical protein